MNKMNKEKLASRKAELIAAKAKGGKAWTQEMQNELDKIVLALVDMEEESDVAKTEEPDVTKTEESDVTKTEEPLFVVPKGEEKLIHVILSHGRRFNPVTGKEESKPFIKPFTFGEYKVFKANAAMLGYRIIQEVHNPYNK
jgi:hypothetical protein